MISVSFLPPMSSSNTHMVTRGSKCASWAALPPTILAMAEPLAGGGSAESGGVREEQWQGRGQCSTSGYHSIHWTIYLPPPLSPPLLWQCVSNEQAIERRLSLPDTAAGEGGQLSDLPTLLPTSAHTAFQAGSTLEAPFLWGIAERQGPGGVRAPSVLWGRQETAAGAGALPAHQASVPDFCRLEGALSAPQHTPWQSCLPVARAYNADFLAGHGAASLPEPPAGCHSPQLPCRLGAYNSNTHVGEAKPHPPGEGRRAPRETGSLAGPGKGGKRRERQVGDRNGAQTRPGFPLRFASWQCWQASSLGPSPGPHPPPSLQWAHLEVCQEQAQIRNKWPVPCAPFCPLALE